jgi:hypothetical protein
MKNRNVLASAVADVLSTIAFDSEGFALAESFDSSTGNYVGLTLPSNSALFGVITDQTLLVKPDVAQKQIPLERPIATMTGDVASVDSQNPEATDTIVPNLEKLVKRYFGVYQLDPERFSRDLNKLSQEILQHLSSIDGVQLGITVEIHAEVSKGFSPEKIRVILENARSLKFEQSKFEQE